MDIYSLTIDLAEISIFSFSGFYAMIVIHYMTNRKHDLIKCAGNLSYLILPYIMCQLTNFHIGHLHNIIAGFLMSPIFFLRTKKSFYLMVSVCVMAFLTCGSKYETFLFNTIILQSYLMYFYLLSTDLIVRI